MRRFPWLSRSLYSIFGMAVVLGLHACALRPLFIPSGPPYSAETIQSILGQLKNQEQGVTTIFESGKLTSKARDSALEASVSIVGRRTPFEARIEFTHPWGAPLAHLVINRDRFRFLVFREKRLYEGFTKQTDLLRYFPFLPEPAAIWGFIRGYPLLLPYEKATSPEAGTIELFDHQGALIQRLDIDLKTQNPKACFYAGNNVTLSFGDFEKKGTLHFAQKVQLKSKTREKRVTLRIRQAIFNPALPRGIFELKRPDGFKVVDLSDVGNAPDRP